MYEPPVRTNSKGRTSDKWIISVVRCFFMAAVFGLDYEMKRALWHLHHSKFRVRNSFPKDRTRPIILDRNNAAQGN